MAEEMQTTNVTDKSSSSSAPATTPPLPFPAERLLGGHEKVNFYDFGMAMIQPFLQMNFAGISAMNHSFATNFSQKLLTDSQNLSVKITTDAADTAQSLQKATAIAISSAQTLNQQNLNPVSQGEGESADAQSYPANRSIDSSTALGTGVVLSNVANALAQGVAALASLTPVLVTASGGASTPSQTQAKPTGSAA